MKTLKFMLAAATAIGLASATQAEQNTGASTGFEKLALDAAVRTGVTDNDANSYFYYAGATTEDNESRIVAAPDLTGAQRPLWVSRFTGADLSSRDKVLQVSTGTDPLLRTLQPITGSQQNPQLPTGQTVTDDIFVDTLVQFTVTPVTDNVVPSNGVDKLMLYLGANTNGEGEVVSKTLKVVGGFLNAQGVVVADEYEVSNVSVDTNAWYRLTVQTIADVSVDDQGQSGNDGSFMGFKLYIDGTLCTLNKKTFDDTDSAENAAWDFVETSIYWDALDAKQIVLSLLATSNVTSKDKLIAVGFAGEGYVDDLVVTTTDPFNANIVDFTFVASGTGVGAVEFTIGSGSPVSSDGKYEVTIGDTITVTAAAQSGYELIAPTFSGLTADPGNTFALATYTVTGTASLTINAQKAAQADWVDDSTTVSNKTAAEVYSDLAKTAFSNADAVALTEWAKATGVSFSEVTADPDDYIEAFLLNCAPTAEAVAEEKEEFVLDISVAADGTITVSLPAGKHYNGTLQMKGSNDLSDWTNVSEASSSYKFYKYELSL